MNCKLNNLQRRFGKQCKNTDCEPCKKFFVKKSQDRMEKAAKAENLLYQVFSDDEFTYMTATNNFENLSAELKVVKLASIKRGVDALLKSKFNFLPAELQEKYKEFLEE